MKLKRVFWTASVLLLLAVAFLAGWQLCVRWYYGMVLNARTDDRHVRFEPGGNPLAINGLRVSGMEPFVLRDIDGNVIATGWRVRAPDRLTSQLTFGKISSGAYVTVLKCSCCRGWTVHKVEPFTEIQKQVAPVKRGSVEVINQGTL